MTLFLSLLIAAASPRAGGVVTSMSAIISSGGEQQFEVEVLGKGDWPLFPPHLVPNETRQLEEKKLPASPASLPNNPDILECAPDDDYGFWYLNVTYPHLVPFVVNGSDTAVIIAPGGGREFLDWNKEGTDAALWFNLLGISAFVLKYRVPTAECTFKPVQDAQRAISLLRSRAGEYGINASRIGIMGFSGGGLVATQVINTGSRLYAPFDAADAFPFEPNFQLLIYANVRPLAVNLTHVPRTFISTALDDDCVPYTKLTQYFHELRLQGLEHGELHVFPDGGHGIGLCVGYPAKWYEACSWPNNAKMFLENQVLMRKLHLKEM